MDKAVVIKLGRVVIILDSVVIVTITILSQDKIINRSPTLLLIQKRGYPESLIYVGHDLKSIHTNYIYHSP
jgi:hypothetical protein